MALTLLLSCMGASCLKPKSVVTIGGMSSTDQVLLSEIMAQVVKERGIQVQRRAGIGSTQLVYQSLIMTEIDMYADSSGSIVTNALRETAERQPGVAWERARGELERLARVKLIGPTALDNSFAIVVRAEDAQEKNLRTISDTRPYKWDLGLTSEFNSRLDGNSALQSTYDMQLRAVPKILDTNVLYDALAEHKLNMVGGNLADGALANAEFVALKDDKNAFAPGQVGFLVRGDVLQKNSGLEAALQALAPRITTAVMRRMAKEIEVKHRPAQDVAADFLAGRIQ